MHDRRRGLRDAVEERVLRGPGRTEPSLRQRAAAGGDVPPRLAGYLERVRTEPTAITDEEVRVLRETYADDFELTAAAALGAALHRLDRGLAAIEALEEV
jgi:hypothetical protein